MLRIRSGKLPWLAFGAIALVGSVSAQVPDSPQTRLRPIGSTGSFGSINPVINPEYPSRWLHETGFQQSGSQQASVQQRVPQQRGPAMSPTNPVRQAAMLQQADGPPAFGGGMALPGNFGSTPPVAPPMTPSQPSSMDPRALPTNPGAFDGGTAFNNGLPSNQNLAPVPVAPPNSSSDFATIPQPQLNDRFATIDNCNCVSPPSSYVSATYGDCVPVSYQPQAVLPPAASVVAPAPVAGGVVSPATAAPAGSLISFGQRAYPVQVAPGLFGQPVAYVQGQPIRNWIRYVFP